MTKYTLRSIVGTLAILLSGHLHAQAQSADSLRTTQHWYTPDAAVLQFAGNMGMLSAGPSYYFAKERIATDLLYGFVPKFDSDEAEHLLTLKTTYRPWTIERRHGFEVIPFQIGLGLSYYFNDKYPLSWDEKYPKNYYWWSPKVRLLGFAGASVNKEIRNSFISKAGIYSELGTYDLLATAWFKEEGALGLWEIVNISIGARVTF